MIWLGLLLGGTRPDFPVLRRAAYFVEEKHLDQPGRETLVRGALLGLRHLELEAHLKGVTLEVRGDEERRATLKAAEYNLADLAQLVVELAPEHSPEAIERAMLEGLLESLARGDRLVPQRDLQPGVGAAGLIVTRLRDGTVIQGVMPGSGPDGVIEAWSSLLSVDGTCVSAASLTTTVEKLRGPVGSEVELVWREQGGAVKTATFERRTFKVNADPVLTMHDSVAWITMPYLFHGHVPQLPAEATGVVLDLRGNSGGQIGHVAAVADAFLGRVPLIVADGPRPDRYLGTRAHNKLPLVVVTDRGTSAGGLAVAGALQVNDRARIVGTMPEDRAPEIHNIYDMPGLDEDLAVTVAELRVGADYWLSDLQPDVHTDATGEELRSIAVAVLKGVEVETEPPTPLEPIPVDRRVGIRADRADAGIDLQVTNLGAYDDVLRYCVDEASGRDRVRAPELAPGQSDSLRVPDGDHPIELLIESAELSIDRKTLPYEGSSPELSFRWADGEYTARSPDARSLTVYHFKTATQFRRGRPDHGARAQFEGPFDDRYWAIAVSAQGLTSIVSVSGSED